MDLTEIDILGESIGERWSYRAKLAALLRFVCGFNPRTALDIGAGSGFFARALLECTGVKGGVRPSLSRFRSGRDGGRNAAAAQAQGHGRRRRADAADGCARACCG